MYDEVEDWLSLRHEGSEATGDGTRSDAGRSSVDEAKTTRPVRSV